MSVRGAEEKRAVVGRASRAASSRRNTIPEGSALWVRRNIESPRFCFWFLVGSGLVRRGVLCLFECEITLLELCSNGEREERGVMIHALRWHVHPFRYLTSAACTT